MGSRTDANPRFRRGGTRYIVGAVSAAHFLSHVYLLAFPPLFPLLGAEFDLTTAQLGLLVTAIYLPTLFLQIPLGELVDRIGAKRILVGGLVVTSLGVALSGLATSYWLLLAFAFLSGIGQSVFHPADYALLESVTTSENQGKAFSLHTFGGFAGFAAAPVLVGGIGIRYGWQAALLAAGSLGFVYAAILLVTAAPVYRCQIRERAASADGSGEPEVAASSDDRITSGNEPEPDASDDGGFVATVSQLLQPKLLVVFGFYLLSMMAIVGLQSFTTVFAVDALGFGDASANNLLTAYLVGTAIGVIAGGPLADRLPFQPILVVAFAAAASGVFLAVIIPSSTGFAAAVTLFTCIGLAIGVALPSRDTFATTVAEAGSTGKSFGFFFTGLSLGAVISPALLGVVIDEVSVGAAFLVIVAILLVAASVIVGVSLVDRRRPSGA
ncbi:MFS transporter [Natronorubrum sp. DTA7]|uniref:MFS transporter n=1 Tax=Natronorubrum sp. DTA7 TaxID=3447016 RepID=UPI003F846290